MDDGYFEKFGSLIKDCIHKDQVELEKVGHQGSSGIRQKTRY